MNKAETFFEAMMVVGNAGPGDSVVYSQEHLELRNFVVDADGRIFVASAHNQKVSID